MTTSPTLAIDDVVRARLRAGRAVVHLGFGEAGLPVLPAALEVLAAAGPRNSYGPVDGFERTREAAAEWFTRRGLPTSAGQVVFGPGSKPLLFALLAVIGGDIVLPRPAWVSYAAQASLLKRPVISAPIAEDGGGGVPDPARLDDALREAVRRGARPGVLLMTIPDNPTGTVVAREELKEACAVADQHGLAVICDEIYAELCHAGTAPSASTYLPERTIVTSGLSKSLALGGWRVGYARTPDTAWGRRLHRDLVGVASEIWSSLANPMQEVAAYALADPPEVRAYKDAARRLHARIATAVHGELVAAGVRCRPPQAGFYLYPDFEPHREALRARGIDTSSALAAHLLDAHDIATLPGAAFGDPDATLTLRLATSLLYGATEQQRWAALEADEPETLPWIAAAVAHLRQGLTELTTW